MIKIIAQNFKNSKYKMIPDPKKDKSFYKKLIRNLCYIAI